MDQNNQPRDAKTEKKVGPIVATLIIVLILIITALYFFASKVNNPGMPATGQPAAVNTQADIRSLQTDLNGATSDLDQQNF